MPDLLLPDLELIDVDEPSAWRIGHEPDPAAWTPRRFAFGQRWDDPARTFRTGYWAASLLGACVELLAFARSGLDEDADFAGIDESPADRAEHPSPPGGQISGTWLRGRMLARARLTSRFCDIGHSRSIAALHPLLVDAAHREGASDFDMAAITDSANRTLTQLLAGWLYTLADEDEEPLVDGVEYPSRHGDDFTLWALFEQPGDDDVSPHLSVVETAALEPDSPDVERAVVLLGLTWT